MGTYFSGYYSQKTNPTSVTKQDGISAKLKIRNILNHWLRKLKINAFPDELKPIIIDTYLYHAIFDNPPKYASSQDPKNQFDYLIKILIIGNANVGKTSLMTRYADGSFPQNSWYNTLGVDFRFKTIGFFCFKFQQSQSQKLLEGSR